MIATLRKVWGLGDAFTARDAAAAPFDHLLSRDSPRDPAGWPEVEALPVPEFHMDMVQMGRALSILRQDRRRRNAGARAAGRARDPARADRPRRPPIHRADRRLRQEHGRDLLPWPRPFRGAGFLERPFAAQPAWA